jgi:hypothetical protein
LNPYRALDEAAQASAASIRNIWRWFCLGTGRSDASDLSQAAILGTELAEERADPSPGCFDRPLAGLAQKCLELGEDLLDWVEVGE